MTTVVPRPRPGATPTPPAPRADPAPRGGVRVDAGGLLLPRTLGRLGPLVVRLDGHYLWAFAPSRDGHPDPVGTRVTWPPVLRPLLDGVARVTVTDPSGVAVLHDAEVSFGTGTGRVTVVDGAGHPLCVDKAGHLTRSFADTTEEVRAEILHGTDRALRDLREGAGVQAYLCYGALLGAVREGAMIGADSDTDVCYASRHSSPADVVAESYRVERSLLARGWRVLRMSGADLKLFLPLADGRTCQIDVFAAFWVGGTFYQLGNRSGRLPRRAVLPLSTVELHGHAFPAPADPEAMLAFLYGPQWRVPDPSFVHVDPPAGVRRLDGWLRGFRTHVSDWADFHRDAGREVRRRRSDFALWVHDQVETGAPLADVGAGTGRDAFFWARRGHRVTAYDFTAVARGRARALARRHGVEVATRKLALGELRQVLLAGAELSRDPHHLTARLLLGALEPHERSHFWLLARMALRGTGRRLFVEFSALDHGLVVASPLPGEPGPSGLVTRLSPRTVRREAEAAGGVVEHLEIAAGVDVTDRPDPVVCRMRIVFPAPTHRTEERA